MERVRVVRQTAVPLERSDVDTDQIIPSDWLRRIERTGFGAGLFEEWRDDPAFVLNRPEYDGAGILVAGPRFGTGSSREHAVWALVDYGFRAVVSSRFGDIFRHNAPRSGLIPAEVDEDVAEALMAAVREDPRLEVVLDVERLVLSAEEAHIHASFRLDDDARHRLLEGLDDIGLTLLHEEEIAAYEGRRAAWLPSVAGRG